MKEIGGYLEFEQYQGKQLHDNAIKLNSGRNCLEYLSETKKIRKLWLPYFCCDSVTNKVKELGIEFFFYNIDASLRPIMNRELKDDEWFYLINFFGQISGEEIKDYNNEYPNLIVDNAQAFFQMPVIDTDTLYTCRKFFGVCDGAYLYTDKLIGKELAHDESFERIHYLLGRFERTGAEFFEEYRKNEESVDNAPLKQMSKLTENLLNGIDYDFVKKRRTENFSHLHQRFREINKLNLNIPDGAFMYPLWIDRGAELRKQLQSVKIYIPTLWPNILKDMPENSLEYEMANNILPLPVDQRYNIHDMQLISNMILNMLEKRR